MDEHRQKLYEQLNQQPLQRLFVLVDLSGASTLRSRGEELLDYGFGCSAWRIENGEVETNPLYVRKLVNEREADLLRGKIKKDAIICITARIARDNVFGKPQALLDQILGETSDDELAHIQDELRQPVSRNDEVFGELKLDRELNWFQGHTDWLGNRIEISVSVDEIDQLKKSLCIAKELWGRASYWNEQFFRAAIEELLEDKNGEWQDDDGKVYSLDEFCNSISLSSIVVNPDRSFDVWIDDGDLFFGHSIEIRASLDAGIYHVGLSG